MVGDDDALLASVARKMLDQTCHEVYAEVSEHGLVVDGTVYGLTDDEVGAVRRVLGDG